MKHDKISLLTLNKVIFALIAFGIFAVLTSVTPIAFTTGGKWFTPPCDFSLRMAEVDCLRRGVDPYQVWKGNVILPPYRPNYGSKINNPECTVDINAYVPWVYSKMLPFSYLPRKIAWGIYFIMMIGAWLLIPSMFSRSSSSIKLAALIGLLLVSYPTWSNLCIGNFSIFVLLAVILMGYFLNRGKDTAAGFCWALAMIKPQLGLIFAIPLLMRKKWKTCFVAGIICAALSIPPAIMCGVSPLTMILQAPSANTFMFHGCGSWPFALCNYLGGNGDVLAALLIGGIICYTLTRQISNQSDWTVFLMPASVCGMSWTYASSYGHVLAWFFFYVLVLELSHNPKDKKLWTLLFLSMLFSTRLYLCYRGISEAFPNSSFIVKIPENIHWHIDSFNSSIDLLLCILLCRWIKVKNYTV